MREAAAALGAAPGILTRTDLRRAGVGPIRFRKNAVTPSEEDAMSKLIEWGLEVLIYIVLCSLLFVNPAIG